VPGSSGEPGGGRTWPDARHPNRDGVNRSYALAYPLGYLEATHQYLTQQRNIRRAVEESLGLYDVKTANGPLLPQNWKRVRITSAFQRLGLVVPMTITIPF
jgi:hypothetical protein